MAQNLVLRKTLQVNPQKRRGPHRKVKVTRQGVTRAIQ